jgi:hypothetical protein
LNSNTPAASQPERLTAHLAERAHLLERLAEVSRALLQLGEQAHVLDGDDRLIGERLQERDVLVGE